MLLQSCEQFPLLVEHSLLSTKDYQVTINPGGKKSINVIILKIKNNNFATRYLPMQLIVSMSSLYPDLHEH